MCTDVLSSKGCAVNASGNKTACTQQATLKFGSTYSDERALEAAISAANDRLCAAPTREEKLKHWREMVRLIDLRSPHRVRFMERIAGLR